MQELLYDLVIGAPGAEQGRGLAATSRTEAVAEASQYLQPKSITEYRQGGPDTGEYWFVESDEMREWGGKPGVWCDASA